MGYRIKIEGPIPTGAETSAVRARFTPDAADDVQGQGSRWGLAPTEDDTAGQGIRAKFVKPVGDDAEGQSWRIKGVTADDEHTQGQGARWNGFEPIGEDEAQGNVLKTHVLEIERDEDGELVGRYVPADDTEGQGARWG